METTEMYRRASGYKDVSGYQCGEFCSKCGQTECEDGPRGLAARKRRAKFYERHCPSCHCPPERRRLYSPGRPRTSENIEAMLNQYERVPVEPISSNIKKSQSSPLSQKVAWHECPTNCRCLRKSVHTRRQRRPPELDRYASRLRRDTEVNNEDLEVCPKYVTQSVPVKTAYSSLKKHCYREPEDSPDEQEFSDAESEACVPRARHPRRSSRAPETNPGTKQRRTVAGNVGEYVAETRHENNDDDYPPRQSNARGGYHEMRKLVLELEELERLKTSRGDGEAAGEGDKRLEGRKPFEARARQRNCGDAGPYFVTGKPSYTLIRESSNKTAKDLTLGSGAAHLTKLDNAARNRVLESIDHMVGIMGDTKADAPTQQEQPTEQETVEKIAHDLQENGWQLLFNALSIHRDATDSSRRTVRLECLDQIRQQLDKLYALESSLDNCPSKQQSLPSHGTFNEDHQQQPPPLEQKVADS